MFYIFIIKKNGYIVFWVFYLSMRNKLVSEAVILVYTSLTINF